MGAGLHIMLLNSRYVSRVVLVPGGLQDFREADGRQDDDGQQNPQQRVRTHHDNAI